ncbi:hypothetical protein ASPTUDRAFT_74670 [Aspergillus tubingensis CBS 134.48]|uniref:Uncharacterized protein n=1 Tax=Aspergillus tubingensis (strain CBS 134.48) TaxID=767770 RepID=A0A1L9N7R8_ASPTC|nr:hypothetical protein ASPTUDRAFT_74670 [Aspergillus tubingensis CBS 134.48]
MFVRPQGGEGSSSVRMVDATSMPSISSLNGPWSNAQIWRYIDFGSNKEILPILGSLIASRSGHRVTRPLADWVPADDAILLGPSSRGYPSRESVSRGYTVEWWTGQEGSE